jgi:hypothetical protein
LFDARRVATAACLGSHRRLHLRHFLDAGVAIVGEYVGKVTSCHFQDKAALLDQIEVERTAEAMLCLTLLSKVKP